MYQLLYKIHVLTESFFLKSCMGVQALPKETILSMNLILKLKSSYKLHLHTAKNKTAIRKWVNMEIRAN